MEFLHDKITRFLTIFQPNILLRLLIVFVLFMNFGIHCIPKKKISRVQLLTPDENNQKFKSSPSYLYRLLVKYGFRYANLSM